MSMFAKYVMTEIGPIIFPDSFNHDHFSFYKPTSAGHVIIEDDEVITFGDSLSLQMKSDKSDAEKIASAFRILPTSE